MESAASSVYQEGYATEIMSEFEFDNSYFGAILRNDLILVQEYLDMGRTPLMVQGSNGMALHYAVRHNKVEVLKLFEPRMKDGDINVLNCLDGLTPLQTSMELQVDVEISEMLCRWGADVNCKSSNGLPALYYLLEASFKNFKQECEANKQKITATIYYEKLTQFANFINRITKYYYPIMYQFDQLQFQQDLPIGFEALMLLLSKLHCLQNTNKHLYQVTASKYAVKLQIMCLQWRNRTEQWPKLGLCSFLWLTSTVLYQTE